MNMFRRIANSNSSPEMRRPVLDPDSDAIAWLNAADASNPASVDRALAAARTELDAMNGRLAEHSDWLDHN